MNSFVKKTSLALLCMTAMGMLSGCGEAEKQQSASGETSDDVLNFVAVTSTAWDAEVTLGSYIYKLDVALKKDNTAKLTGTCTAEQQQQQGGNQGGGFDFGGGGFPGGDQPGGQQGGEQPGGDQQQSQEGGFPGGPQGAQDVPEASASASVDLSAHNFSVSGTWTLDKGYGYDIVLGGKTIHANYVKIEARHEFYYTVSANDASSSVKFQAKDADFRKTLAADWAPYYERNAEISFCAAAEGNNSSVDTAYFYLIKGGETYLNKPSGSARSIDTTATWTKDAQGVYQVTKGTTTVAVATSVAGADHSGFRLVWDGKTFLCCTSGDKDWTSMTSADFDGRTRYAFVGNRQYQSGPPGSYANASVEMNLTDTNRFYAYEDGKIVKQGAYTFANEVFTITPDGEDPITVAKENGVYTCHLTWTYEVQRGPNVSTQNAEVDVVYTPAA